MIRRILGEARNIGLEVLNKRIRIIEDTQNILSESKKIRLKYYKIDTDNYFLKTDIEI
jgi:5-methylthioribose kinase